MGSALFRLSDKRAVVTGAASGIGFAIARALGQHGAHVILADINEAGLETAASELRNAGVSASIFACDLGRHNAARALAEAALGEGPVDILACCAGIEGPVGSMVDVEDADWERVMNINLRSALWLAQAILPSMAERGSGSMIAVSSIAGLRGNKMIGTYGVAKAALSQLVRNLAVEFGPHGINVNAIAPGLIRTPFSETLMGNDAFMDRRLAMTPLRRVGRPEEIAATAVYLASEGGRFTTGQTIVVDGGTLISDGN